MSIEQLQIATYQRKPIGQARRVRERWERLPDCLTIDQSRHMKVLSAHCSIHLLVLAHLPSSDWVTEAIVRFFLFFSRHCTRTCLWAPRQSMAFNLDGNLNVCSPLLSLSLSLFSLFFCAILFLFFSTFPICPHQTKLHCFAQSLVIFY